ncbi:MAG: hypothetical protein LBU34_06160 [Planctomycetaceae bacterium]|nr:hypothetical protein [Planctomycetaceae bacterium]
MAHGRARVFKISLPAVPNRHLAVPEITNDKFISICSSFSFSLFVRVYGGNGNTIGKQCRTSMNLIGVIRIRAFNRFQWISRRIMIIINTIIFVDANDERLPGISNDYVSIVDCFCLITGHCVVGFQDIDPVLCSGCNGVSFVFAGAIEIKLKHGFAVKILNFNRILCQDTPARKHEEEQNTEYKTAEGNCMKKRGSERPNSQQLLPKTEQGQSYLYHPPPPHLIIAFYW